MRVRLRKSGGAMSESQDHLLLGEDRRWYAVTYVTDLSSGQVTYHLYSLYGWVSDTDLFQTNQITFVFSRFDTGMLEAVPSVSVDGIEWVEARLRGMASAGAQTTIHSMIDCPELRFLRREGLSISFDSLPEQKYWMPVVPATAAQHPRFAPFKQSGWQPS